MSHFINRSITILFSPYGVALTAITAVGVHAYMTSIGEINSLFAHWALAINEWAIVVGGMVGHSTLVSGKANAVQQSALIRAVPDADNKLAGAHALPEGKIDQLAQELEDVESSE